MQKIMVIGCCGAGKSTFSRRLHTVTGLELIHLDQQHWQPNWHAGYRPSPFEIRHQVYHKN